MGRKPNWPPKLTQKPNTTEARTYYAGRWWTCGKWDVARGEADGAAKAEHARLIAGWLVDPGSAVRPKGEYLLSALLADWAESSDKPDTFEARRRLRRASELLGPLLATPAASFTPALFTAWRKEVVSAGRSRVTVKAYTLPVLRAFQWGEDAERLPEGLAARLWAVATRRGCPGRGLGSRSPADPVSVAAVDQHLALHRPDLVNLFRLHALTGARVGELLVLTVSDVCTRGKLVTNRGAMLDLTKEKVWAADLLGRHKTAHKGGERVLVFGPRAQKVLAAVMRGRPTGERLFPLSGVRMGGLKYMLAVVRACKAVGVPHFAPRQLRQLVANRVRDALTGEHTAAYLGHGPQGVTERHYLTIAVKKAAEAARKVG